MYDRTREQALAGFMVGWAVLVGLAAIASAPHSHLWHQWWFVGLAVMASVAGLFGLWASLALMFQSVPFPRTEIPDTHAQHIGLRTLLAEAVEHLRKTGGSDDPASFAYARDLQDLLFASLGKADADGFRQAIHLGDGWGLLEIGAGAGYLHGLFPRLDQAVIRRDFDPAEWHSRISLP